MPDRAPSPPVSRVTCLSSASAIASAATVTTTRSSSPSRAVSFARRALTGPGIAGQTASAVSAVSAVAVRVAGVSAGLSLHGQVPVALTSVPSPKLPPAAPATMSHCPSNASPAYTVGSGSNRQNTVSPSCSKANMDSPAGSCQSCSQVTAHAHVDFPADWDAGRHPVAGVVVDTPVAPRTAELTWHSNAAPVSSPAWVSARVRVGVFSLIGFVAMGFLRLAERVGDGARVGQLVGRVVVVAEGDRPVRGPAEGGEDQLELAERPFGVRRVPGREPDDRDRAGHSPPAQRRRCGVAGGHADEDHRRGLATVERHRADAGGDELVGDGLAVVAVAAHAGAHAAPGRYGPSMST